MRAFASSDKIRFLRAFTGLGVDSTSAFGGLPLLGFAAKDGIVWPWKMDSSSLSKAWIC